MTEHPQRRAGDFRLALIADGILEIKEDLRETREEMKETRKELKETREDMSEWKGENRGSIARMDQRMIAVEAEQGNHSKEIRDLREVDIKDLREDVQVVTAWMNHSAGVSAVIKFAGAGVFSMVGASIMWLGEHVLAPWILKGHK